MAPSGVHSGSKAGAQQAQHTTLPTLGKRLFMQNEMLPTHLAEQRSLEAGREWLHPRGAIIGQHSSAAVQHAFGRACGCSANETACWTGTPQLLAHATHNGRQPKVPYTLLATHHTALPTSFCQPACPRGRHGHPPARPPLVNSSRCPVPCPAAHSTDIIFRSLHRVGVWGRRGCD